MLTAATLALLSTVAAPPETPQFRVVTELQAPGGGVHRHLWIFQGATAVDVRLPERDELILFDHAAGEIVLLDPVGRRQTVIDELALVRFMADLRAKIAAEGKDEQFATAARPTAAEGGALTVQAGPYVYHATMIAAPQAACASAFSRAANHAARLNALEGLGLPPFARMALSEEMAGRGMLPGEITLQRSGGDPADSLRVRHIPTWQLDAEDLQLLQEARQMRSSFREVPFQEFRKAAR